LFFFPLSKKVGYKNGRISAGANFQKTGKKKDRKLLAKSGRIKE